MVFLLTTGTLRLSFAIIYKLPAALTLYGSLIALEGVIFYLFNKLNVLLREIGNRNVIRLD